VNPVPKHVLYCVDRKSGENFIDGIKKLICIRELSLLQLPFEPTKKEEVR
jgi:hypothetical protein